MKVDCFLEVSKMFTLKIYMQATYERSRLYLEIHMYIKHIDTVHT